MAERHPGPLLGSVALVLLGGSLLALVLRRPLGVDGPGFTSVFQGTIRVNTYLGVAMSAALFGPAGVTSAALVIALMIPLVNVLCVTVLLHYAGGRGVGIGTLLAAMARNPLILACLVGLTLDLSGVGMPPGSRGIFDILSRPALALGLLAVGAGLHLRIAFGQPRILLTVSALKLLAMPALAALATWATGLDRDIAAALILFAALPGATSAYILARQLGGDEKLMASLVTVQHGLGMVTMPAVLWALTVTPG